MGRPTGSIKQSSVTSLILSELAFSGQRRRIDREIIGQTGCTPEHAGLPSVHLRWALRQIKTRGWSNNDWGSLFDGNTLGDGPICILESVRAASDVPSALHFESNEQKYIRLACRVLGVEPVPVYVSKWNDMQAEVDPIITVLEKAAELAENDEIAGHAGGEWPKEQEDLMLLFGLTEKALTEAGSALDEELAQERATSTLASTPVFGGDDAGSGPATGHGGQGPSATFDAPQGSATDGVAE